MEKDELIYKISQLEAVDSEVEGRINGIHNQHQYTRIDKKYKLRRINNKIRKIEENDLEQDNKE